MIIPASIEPRIQQRLDSGDYRSLEELLDAALSSLEESEEEGLEEIRALVQEGIDDIERHGDIPSEEAVRLLREHQARYLHKPTS